MARIFVPTNENIARMKILIGQDADFVEISGIMGCTERTVQNWNRKFIADDEGIIDAAEDRRVYNGGTKKMSGQNLQRAVRLLQNDPSQSAKGLPALLDIDVCAATMRKSLKECAQYGNFTAAIKPFFSVRNLEDRLTYAF
ncbi:hypothetical protein QAD02_002697 [Eretmocerus hayati]|uniref:Uncharacterized protein n=1 Tax=Eretmocerus hayati TaxID=131215 RepID=A0ACC2NJR5_9HYME|nr:hypothetical protein QAD02_002697 [Eretmocerus hayati]